ncbi:MAG: DNA alkylation repair protein [Bacteroidota bacterium]
MNKEILNRKGARKVQDIPEEVLNYLNKGTMETVNLTEWLAIDHVKLINTVFPEFGVEQETLAQISKAIASQKKPTAMSTTKLVGTMLYETHANAESFDELIDQISTHTSDTVRCYATYLIGLNERLSIREKLEQSRELVADHHFGVREVVWMALRPEIEENLEVALSILNNWTSDPDENIRRFTTEATRPRGVWCKHIDQLKEHPELALLILENLKSDSSKYVQDSVGNWLNDSSKTRPDFVMELTEKWQSEAPSKETQKIIKRARRTIDKK